MWLLVLASMLAAARSCDICVDYRCYTRKMLGRDLYIADQMAINMGNNTVYVHTNAEINAAFFHEDLTIQLVGNMNYSGLAVDQDTQDLYTTDSEHLYRYSRDSTNTLTANIVHVSNETSRGQLNSLFYKNCLIATETQGTGLWFFSVTIGMWQRYAGLENYTISDFVATDCLSGKIYFVANDTTYVYDDDTLSIHVLATKRLVLSTNKHGGIFFGDATVNVIYTVNSQGDELLEHAAYESGSVDKFVFDNNNNVVSYDSSDGSLSIWERNSDDSIHCSIERPIFKYQIKTINTD